MTSGQVASIVRRLRFAEFSWTDGRDAVGAEDDQRALGHLGLLLDEDRAALGRAARRRACCGRSPCARRRAAPCRSSACSTVCTARSTPGAVAARGGEQERARGVDGGVGHARRVPAVAATARSAGAGGPLRSRSRPSRSLPRGPTRAAPATRAPTPRRRSPRCPAMWSCQAAAARRDQDREEAEAEAG